MYIAIYQADTIGLIVADDWTREMYLIYSMNPFAQVPAIQSPDHHSFTFRHDIPTYPDIHRPDDYI